MVNATAGAFLTCDIPVKEYLVYLNDQNRSQNRGKVFIIKVLDDTHLLVKEDLIDYIHKQVKLFNESHVYAPPPMDQ